MPQIDPTWTVATLLLWARLGALLVLGPLGQAIKAPPVFWVLFTLALSGSLCVALGLRTPVPGSLAALAAMLLSEALLGVLLGFSLHTAFAALAMAGRLLDLQMGFGMAAVLDPVTRVNAPVIGIALSMLGMSVFLGSDAHHLLLRGVSETARWIPPGALWQLPDAAALLRAVAALFTMSVVVMAPALFLLLMVELVLDVVSRVMPQMNVMFIGMPLKVLVGLSALAAAAPGMAPALRRLQAGVFDFWQGVLP